MDSRYGDAGRCLVQGAGAPRHGGLGGLPTFTAFTQKLKFFPTLDLFASRLNTKCKRYYSFRDDPHTAGVDALSEESAGDTLPRTLRLRRT